MLGLVTFILGVILTVITVSVVTEKTPDAIAIPLFAASMGLYCLGPILTVVSLTAYIILTMRSIQIRRIGRDTITLKRVAPELAEAYRVHSSEQDLH